MTRNLVPAMMLAAALAACSRAPEMDEDMQRDLQAAAGSIELAPRGDALRTVSALEQNLPAQPTVTPVRQVRAPAKTPRPETPQPAPQAAEPKATAPVSAPPRVQPPPPGGYKTMNDVIRNAPFPIKP